MLVQVEANLPLESSIEVEVGEDKIVDEDDR